MASRSFAVTLAMFLALLIGAAAGDETGSDITIKEVTVSLLEASGTPAATQKLTAPGGAQQLVLDHTRTLKVSLMAALASAADEAFRPQQAFLRLTHAASGAAAYFPAVRAKDGTLYTTAKSADILKQIGLQGGAFSADLLLGDTRSAQPLQWVVGEVAVLHPPLDDGSQPVAEPYRAVDRMFQPLPEIQHAARAPERRAPRVLSVIFSVMAAEPAVIFVAAALQMGGNLKGFPTGGSALVAAGFHGGLLSILALYLLFWIKLTLLQTVPLLAVLAVVTALFGASTLGQLSSVRQKQE